MKQDERHVLTGRTEKVLYLFVEVAVSSSLNRIEESTHPFVEISGLLWREHER